MILSNEFQSEVKVSSWTDQQREKRIFTFPSLSFYVVVAQSSRLLPVMWKSEQKIILELNHKVDFTSAVRDAKEKLF
jgi:hypothetical protein